MVSFEEPKDIAQEPDDQGRYTCPVCRDYTGPRSSVEAHITGKSDSDHKGQVGKDYRVRDGDGELHISDSPVFRVGDRDRTVENNGTGDDPELEDDTSDDDSDDLGAALVAGLVVLVLWLASQTGNENQVRDRFGRP
jgi:hypothetical protein